MKIRGSIISLNPAKEEGDTLELVVAASGTMNIPGFTNQKVTISMTVTAPRSVLRDYRVGDFYMMSIEKAEL